MRKSHWIGSLLAVFVLAWAGLSLAQNSPGGAFITNFNYVLSGQWTWRGASPWLFEGATDNAYETTFTVTDPTADRTWTLPDATDTFVGRATTDTLTNKTLTSPTLTSATVTSPTVTGAVFSAGPFRLPRTVVADAAYTTLSTDVIVAYSALTAARNIRLVSAASLTGLVQIFSIESISTSTLTILPSQGSSETIDGGSQTSISGANRIRLYSNGVSWISW